MQHAQGGIRGVSLVRMRFYMCHAEAGTVSRASTRVSYRHASFTWIVPGSRVENSKA